MKIEQIDIRNFRSLEHLQLKFIDNRTLIIGQNGAGKSSVIDAIAWCLTGRCRGVNGKGEGQKDLIRIGADDASVTVQIESTDKPLVATRTISRNGSASANAGAKRVAGMFFEGELQAVLYGHTFFDLHHADAKALLMGALNVTVPAADLPGVDTDGVQDVDLEFLDHLYAKAFDNRAAMKRQLQAMVVPPQPKVIDMALAGKSQADLTATLKVEQDRLQQLASERAQAEMALDTRTLAITEAKALIDSTDKLQGALQVHRDSLAAADEQLKAGQLAMNEANAMPAEPVDMLAAQVHETTVLIDKLARHDPDRGCVLSAAIPCLTKATEFAGHIEAMRRATKVLQERIAAGNQRLAAQASATQSMRDAQRHLAYHRAQIEATEAKLKQAGEAASQLKDLRAGLPERKRALQESADRCLAQRAEVDRLTGQIASLATYLAAQEAHQRAVQAAADLEAQVAKAEDLVKLLGPSGVRVNAMASSLGLFHERINEALSPFGFSLAISVDPWQVVVSHDGGAGIRFEMLSKGQRLWVSLAFQLAMAKVTGLDFVAIDDVEAIVGKNRTLVTSTVLKSDVGQIVVAMATPPDYQAPKVDGLQVVHF